MERRYEIDIIDPDDALACLMRATGRSTVETLVRDALNLYGFLANKRRAGDKIFCGATKDNAVELDVTTFKGLYVETKVDLARGRIEHLIDCDATPHEPEGIKVHEHVKGGNLKWDPSKVELFLSREQSSGGCIQGTALQHELQGKPVMNANVLDYLLDHPELIPLDWKGKNVFFWGTIYRGSGGDLCVRCLSWSGYGWYSDHERLGGDWGGVDHAALLAKQASP